MVPVLLEETKKTLPNLWAAHACPECTGRMSDWGAAAELPAQVLHRGPLQARHVHLRDAQPFGHLRLRQLLDEAQGEDLALARAEMRHHPLEDILHLDTVEVLIVLAEPLAEGGGILAGGGVGRLQRDRVLGRRDLAGRKHLVRLDAEAVGDLRDRWLAAELVLQLLAHRVDPHQVLLQAPRHPDRPGAVAEVAADLAGDRRRGEGAELVLKGRIEALDGLDEADEADLLDVLQGLAAVGEAARDEVHQIAVQLHQAIAEPPVAGAVELAQQAPHLLSLRRRLGFGDAPLARPLGDRTAAPRRAHETRYLVRRTRSPPVRSSSR